MLTKVIFAMLLTLGIGATSAVAASRKGPVLNAYASTASVPSGEEQLFRRAKGGLASILLGATVPGNVPALNAYASTASVPSAEEQLFRRAKGGLASILVAVPR